MSYFTRGGYRIWEGGQEIFRWDNGWHEVTPRRRMRRGGRYVGGHCPPLRKEGLEGLPQENVETEEL